jgi:dTDP-4-amino-4,6-dideoxygalactose transaminase
MGDLGAEYRSLKPEIDAAIQRVLDSGNLVLGEELEAFEEAFARYCGARHAVGVGSGTAALQLALLACDLEPGAEVITAPNSDSPTTSAITHAGGTPVWAEIDPRTFNLDPGRIEERITARTRALLPVHLFGQPADMAPIMAIARRHGLLVIEDAALAVGAEYAGRKVGTFGDVGCFSLAPSKVLGALGDAGIVVTDSQELADRVRVLRNYGHGAEMTVDEHELIGIRSWRVVREGYNERLDTLQAAVLRAKLPTLDRRIERRRAAAAAYDALLAEAALQPPAVVPDARHVYLAYTLLLDRREQARDFLAARGVASRIYYAPPLHLQDAYRHLGLGPGAFPVTEDATARMLSLPVFPQITDEQVRAVAAAVTEFTG